MVCKQPVGSLRTAAILSSISCSHYDFLHKPNKNNLDDSFKSSEQCDDSFRVFMKEINPLLVQCFKYKMKRIKSDMRCVRCDRELLLLSRKKDRLYKVYL